MPAASAYILALGGAIFIGLALFLGEFLGGTALAVPVLGFAALALWATSAARHVEPIDLSPAAGKMVSRATIAEAVAIPVGILLVANTGHREWIVPEMALVVGLHFIPLAAAIPRRSYWVLAAMLIAAAIAGFVLPAPRNILVCGLGAGFSEWGFAVLAIIGLHARAVAPVDR